MIKQGRTALLTFCPIAIMQCYKSKATQISRVAFVVAKISVDKVHAGFSDKMSLDGRILAKIWEGCQGEVLPCVH
jgi:hypothetical protein